MDVNTATPATTPDINYSSLPELHLERHERALIAEALRRAPKRPDAAALLGISRFALGRAMKKHGITLERPARVPKEPKRRAPKTIMTEAGEIRLPPKRARVRKPKAHATQVGVVEVTPVPVPSVEQPPPDFEPFVESSPPVELAASEPVVCERAVPPTLDEPAGAPDPKRKMQEITRRGEELLAAMMAGRYLG